MEGTPGVSKTKSTSHIHSVSPSGYNLPAPKITEKTHDALITSGRAVEGKRGYNIPSSRVSSGYNIKPAVSAQRIFQREVGKKEELEKESEGIILVSHPVPAHTILEEKTLLEQLKRERQEHPLEIRLYKNLLEQISEETLSLSQEEAKVYLKDFPPGTCVIIPSGENTSKGDLKEYTLVIKESDSIFKEIPFIASKEKGIVKNADRKLNLHRVRPIPSLREFFREVDREYPLEKSVGQIEKDRQIENLRKELIDVSDERAKNMKKRELIKLLDTGLETSEVDDICDFIEKNRSQYLGENHYIKKHVSKLARTLQFTASGDVYIHLKGKALTPKHAGKDKTGTITVRYNEADIIHNASQKIHKEHEARLNFEESLQRRYNGLEGFLPFHDITSYSVPTKTTEELGVPDVSKKNYLRPYYQGGNVSDLMKAERKENVDFEKISQVMIPPLKALVVMHRDNILHRDINMGNLLFKSEKNVAGINLKVTDAVLTDFGESIPLSQKETVIGGPEFLPFMSPEFARAEIEKEKEALSLENQFKEAVDNFDQKDDLWKLGMVLYHMIYGIKAKAEWEDEFLSAKSKTGEEKIQAIQNGIEEIDNWYEEMKKRDHLSEEERLLLLFLNPDPRGRISAEDALRYLGVEFIPPELPVFS